MIGPVVDHDGLQRRGLDEPTRRPDAPVVEAGQNPLLELQRTAGNQAVSQLVQRAPMDAAVPLDAPATTDAPGAKPKPAKPAPNKAVSDIKARVIGLQVDQGQLVITISAGTEQGVKVGMAGSLVEADGKEYADFTIEKAGGGTAIAHVKATQDQVSKNPGVVIKASKFSEPDLGDKQF
jgi:hypothetical protein